MATSGQLWRWVGTWQGSARRVARGEEWWEDGEEDK